ncbi:Kinesin-4 [Capsicum chinense]|nr:Kinesin-4 [Capsicum chinense]
MENQTIGRGHEYNLAWKKAEKAALRRYQATHWLECFVGPLGISSQPSEREFVSCLRSGFVLCNLINKVQPGSVPKVVEIHTPSQSIMWDSQPLPAYQYFENIRNFLVAAEDLKLPAFEASIFERFKSDSLREMSCSDDNSACIPLQNISNLTNRKDKCCRACIKKGKCNHWTLVVMQEKELSNLKVLLASTKREFENLQSQLQSDLKQLGDQVLDMSNAALGYHKVMKENRTLHNMVQDLKGNIRVYCRIRPAFDAEAKTVIDFIGEDGSLVVIDSLKPWKDGRKIFEFNRVFGSSATQEDVFRDTKPLVRSVMDGYNVCIFAYGQTGSGKTYTMSGPGGESTKEFGINQLALNDLFLLSDERKDIMSYKIHVQMVEIYNEQIRDLLADDPLLTKYPFIVIFP